MKRITLTEETTRAIYQRIVASHPKTPETCKTLSWQHCVYCGIKFALNHIHDKRTWDHVYPRSQKGIIALPSCSRCNAYKGSMGIVKALKHPKIKERQERSLRYPGSIAPQPLTSLRWIELLAKEDAMLRKDTITLDRREISRKKKAKNRGQ